MAFGLVDLEQLDQRRVIFLRPPHIFFVAWFELAGILSDRHEGPEHRRGRGWVFGFIAR